MAKLITVKPDQIGELIEALHEAEPKIHRHENGEATT